MRLYINMLKHCPLYLLFISVEVNAANCTGSDSLACSESNYYAETPYTISNRSGDLSLSFTDSSISAPGVAINESAGSAGEARFQASNLTTPAGNISISGGGIDARISDSVIGGGDTSSALSVWQKNVNMDMNLAISHSTFNGSTIVNDAQGNISFTADTSHFYGELHIHETNIVPGAGNSRTTSVDITNSTIDTTNIMQPPGNFPLYVESDRGDVSVTLTNDVIKQSGTNNDVTVSSGAGNNTGSNVEIAIKNSQLTNGVSATTTNANATSTVTISDSTISQNTPSWGTAVVAANGESQGGYAGSGTAAIDIKNSHIYGNVMAESLGGGSTRVLLQEGSIVTGSITALGTENNLTIADATLNGDIRFGTLRDDASVTTRNTVFFSDTVYGSNIIALDQNTEDELTLNVGSNAIIGGNSVDEAMQITGFDTVNVNINYLDPSLVNSGSAKYFYFNEGESVSVNNGTSGALLPVRSGSYIEDNIQYVVTDTSAEQSPEKEGSTYGVTFISDTPREDKNVASDILAAQAGLAASSDMIHRIADDITRKLDLRPQDSAIWVSGLASRSDRESGQARYQNKIAGSQLGGYMHSVLSNDDTLTMGFATGYLHNDLDLRDRDGDNSINGTYYSAYGRWEQQPDKQAPRWFTDVLLTYGDMTYRTHGNDNGIGVGGDYDGRSWLAQGRFGATLSLGQFEFQPYTTLGYSNISTDGFNDGYSYVGQGKQTTYFAGGGMRVATNIATQAVQNIQPYLSVGYRGDLDNSTEMNTADYSFTGEDLNAGSVGAGVIINVNQNWTGSAQISTQLGQSVDNAVDSNIQLNYQF
ncbi:autotransporter outer membrane beta-barrel domain-containing protein [Pseudescherichia sp.]|uniref:autotransporter family protein n=1 Tax=Pseudescherichia sp. TaxID=2055881 RepID=UPI00289EF3C3|nr:autotransporter outer membrane beta-barrel domain-containing protein [Pseudescherichia sp.]